MTIFRLALPGLAAATLLFAGCAENRYCAKPQDYERAESIPAIHAVDNLKVVPSPDAYLIPAVPDNPVPFGQKVPVPGKPGDTQWACLDQPPPLPRPAAQPAP